MTFPYKVVNNNHSVTIEENPILFNCTQGFTKKFGISQPSQILNAKNNLDTKCVTTSPGLPYSIMYNQFYSRGWHGMHNEKDFSHGKAGLVHHRRHIGIIINKDTGFGTLRVRIALCKPEKFLCFRVVHWWLLVIARATQQHRNSAIGDTPMVIIVEGSVTATCGLTTSFVDSRLVLPTTSSFYSFVPSHIVIRIKRL